MQMQSISRWGMFGEEQPDEPDYRDVMHVNALRFGTRLKNCLRNEEITTIGQLRALSDREMSRWPNFSHGSLKEVREVLDHLDAHPDWPPDYY